MKIFRLEIKRASKLTDEEQKVLEENQKLSQVALEKQEKLKTLLREREDKEQAEEDALGKKQEIKRRQDIKDSLLIIREVEERIESDNDPFWVEDLITFLASKPLGFPANSTEEAELETEVGAEIVKIFGNWKSLKEFIEEDNLGRFEKTVKLHTKYVERLKNPDSIFW